VSRRFLRTNAIYLKELRIHLTDQSNAELTLGRWFHGFCFMGFNPSASLPSFAPSTETAAGAPEFGCARRRPLAWYYHRAEALRRRAPRQRADQLDAGNTAPTIGGIAMSIRRRQRLQVIDRR
jgi:hypothetical protein